MMPTLSTFLRLLIGRRPCSSSSSVRPEIKNMSRESSSRAAAAGRGKREQQCAAAQRSDQEKKSSSVRQRSGAIREKRAPRAGPLEVFIGGSNGGNQRRDAPTFSSSWVRSCERGAASFFVYLFNH